MIFKLKKRIKPIHEHEFVTPVEFSYKTEGSLGGYVYLRSGYVTKLRCKCGEEEER